MGSTRYSKFCIARGLDALIKLEFAKAWQEFTEAARFDGHAASPLPLNPTCEDFQDAVLDLMAALPYPTLQCALGYFHLRGQHGFERDGLAACHYFRQAAQQGDAQAQYQLGLTLHYLAQHAHKADLELARQEKIEAGFWFTLSARQDYPGAEIEKIKIAEGMTPADLRAAENRVAAWLTENHNIVSLFGYRRMPAATAAGTNPA